MSPTSCGPGPPTCCGTLWILLVLFIFVVDIQRVNAETSKVCKYQLCFRLFLGRTLLGFFVIMLCNT